MTNLLNKKNRGTRPLNLPNFVFNVPYDFRRDFIPLG